MNLVNFPQMNSGFTKEKIDTFTYVKNEQGQEVFVMNDKNNDGIFDWTHESKYNEEGLVYEENSCLDSDFNGIFDLTSNSKIEYDENGNKVSKAETTHFYDENGLIESTIYNEYAWEYDSEGNMISEITTEDGQKSVDDKITGLKTVYKYDEDGNVISTTVWDDSNYDLYDENGILREHYVNTEDGYQSSKYNENGDLISVLDFKQIDDNVGNYTTEEDFYDNDKLLKTERREVYLGHSSKNKIETDYYNEAGDVTKTELDHETKSKWDIFGLFKKSGADGIPDKVIVY